MLRRFPQQPDKSYSHYRQDAVFHDPVSIATGLESIKSQFNGMPKIFSRSDTQKCELLDPAKATEQSANASTHRGEGGNIVLDLTQHYVFKGDSTPEKTLNSKVTLKLDNQGMIQHHEVNIFVVSVLPQSTFFPLHLLVGIFGWGLTIAA